MVRKSVVVVLVLLSISVIALAQQPNVPTKDHPMITEHEKNACSGEHKIGDHLRCYLEFAGDPKFTGGHIEFRLQGDTPENQKGLPGAFTLYSFRKLSNGVYLVEDELHFCAAGTYKATIVYASISGIGDRNYWFGSEFKDVVEIRVVNPETNLFPPLKSVSAELPHVAANPLPPVGVLPTAQ